ncbi:30S ribosomal protein S21 [Rhizobium sp. BK176]|uniref:30S ribosomal protein S21 n=1 Tax=Rhizobium sp. BK176 TaxID=2587071 RepID=UPI001152ECBB|nr:30S ribosomal protein S21 [Rhizobium sp. BK176]MCS4089748.1 small subunit ribosomal protein S21 [Rhizobium sp. BK176]MCZ7861730.1 30S ribosomal protein S21 [Agrobacterium salinitolerans]
MKVIVRNGDVNQALRVMKRKLQQEGVFREMRNREAYEKPSDKRRREKGEAVRRKQRELRKRQAAERSGR